MHDTLFQFRFLHLGNSWRLETIASSVMPYEAAALRKAQAALVSYQPFEAQLTSGLLLSAKQGDETKVELALA